MNVTTLGIDLAKDVIQPGFRLRLGPEPPGLLERHFSKAPVLIFRTALSCAVLDSSPQETRHKTPLLS